MMKRFGKYILIISSSVVLAYGTLKACADYWGWIYDSNFAPEAFVDESYKPLFLSEDMFYESMYDNTITTRFVDLIKLDWHNYLSPKLDTATINALVFNLNAEELIAIKASSKGKSIVDSLKLWVNRLNIKKNYLTQVIDYLIEAKKVEKYSTYVYDYWDYESNNEKSFLPLSQIKSLESKYTTTSDSFLKKRYWYLLCKAWFYSSKPEGILTHFERSSSSIQKDYLYYSALGYVAGVKYKKKNFIESNYLYSRIFAECLAMRTTATFNYHPLETEDDFNQSLKLATNQSEKAALWALQGYYTDENQAIKEIYALDPKSPYLDFLLSRLINKTERKIFSWYEQDENQDVEASLKEAVSDEKYSLIKRIALQGNTSNPYFWKVALGYVEFLKSNFEQAAAYYRDAEHLASKSPLLRDQLRLLNLLNTIGATSNSKQLNNSNIVADLHWLYKEQEENDYYNRPPLRTAKSQQWIKTQLVQLFSKENNSIYKELISEDVEFYQQDANIGSMKNFLQKPDKTILEHFLTEMYTIKLSDIYEYEAIRATFSNNISDAIAFMEQTDTLKNITLAANPFNGFIQDCHDCEFARPQKKLYSKIEFLKTIKLMQEKIANNDDIYQNSLLLGNAFYNISHFGNARLFYQGKIIPSWTTPFGYDYFNRKLLTNNKIAENYYKMAFANASNKEQKAKSLYMLAKCERNEFYNTNFYFNLNDTWSLWDAEIHFKAWESFVTLKNDYSETEYYKQIIQECGYFEKYVQNSSK